MMMEKQVHVLAVPFPAQGHIVPLMKLSNLIANNGIKVTFVIPESIHDKVLSVSWSEKDAIHREIHVVAIPDGIMDQQQVKKEQIDNWNVIFNFLIKVFNVMPGKLEELIKKMNSSEDEKIDYVIADSSVGWALEMAEKMGVKTAMFCPTTVESISLSLQIPKLLDEGILDHNGTPLMTNMIQVSPEFPAISTLELPWIFPEQPIWQKFMFQCVLNAMEAAKTTNCLLCNSFYDLNPLACDLIPILLPVGPLLSSNNTLEKPAGSLWPVDLTTLNWLDEQPVKSVIYVAFGSAATLCQRQFEELALGLELLGHPFLWVIRSDFLHGSTIKYPDGFLDRTANRGKIVEWAPQEKILSHPSVACFLSHCGWNSTMEGIYNGVPFMCWPRFADQFHIRTYICEFWKVGLGLTPEENGIISRDDIKEKIERLLSDTEIKERALKLKQMARMSLDEGGSSWKNLKFFIELLKS